MKLPTYHKHQVTYNKLHITQLITKPKLPTHNNPQVTHSPPTQSYPLTTNAKLPTHHNIQVTHSSNT